jgi:hypothetical protein
MILNFTHTSTFNGRIGQFGYHSATNPTGQCSANFQQQTSSCDIQRQGATSAGICERRRYQAAPPPS